MNPIHRTVCKHPKIVGIRGKSGLTNSDWSLITGKDGRNGLPSVSCRTDSLPITGFNMAKIVRGNKTRLIKFAKFHAKDVHWAHCLIEFVAGRIQGLQVRAQG